VHNGLHLVHIRQAHACQAEVEQEADRCWDVVKCHWIGGPACELGIGVGAGCQICLNVLVEWDILQCQPELGVVDSFLLLVTFLNEGFVIRLWHRITVAAVAANGIRQST
jgi:hypothetical protein